MAKTNEETLFDAARNLVNPAARCAFLDQACAGDPDLRARIEALLEAGVEAEDFFKDAGRFKAQLSGLSDGAAEKIQPFRMTAPAMRNFLLPKASEPASAITNCCKKSAKAAAAWFIWPNRKSLSAAGSRSKLSSWAWTPKVSSPASRPNGRRWR